MSKITSLISEIVDSSDGKSITSGFEETFKKLSDYFLNVTQKVKILAGKNINDTIHIERFGKKIFLKDILIDTSKNIEKLGENLVSFGIGDIIGANEKGSLSISIDGYTKFELNSNSKIKISEVGENFLTYENLSGKVKYDFSKRDNFKYKIKGKTSIATIRGTILEIECKDGKDIYNLIKGSIEIFNNKTKQKSILNAPFKITI